MRDYEAKVAVEGELSEDELPMEVLDQVCTNLLYYTIPICLISSYALG